MINKILLRFILLFFVGVVGYAVFSPADKSTSTLQVTKSVVHEHSKARAFAPGRLQSHFLKHGRQFGSITEEDYLVGAQNLLNAAPSTDLLEKISPDGDIEHYRPSTHEFAVMTSSGRIRTYFIADQGYWEKQRNIAE